MFMVLKTENLEFILSVQKCNNSSYFMLQLYFFKSINVICLFFSYEPCHDK